MNTFFEELTRAQESRMAIEKLYIEMRHVLNNGYFKPTGRTGKPLIEALLTLRPEIYGSINDPEKVELEGIVYVIDRLPKGIEMCRLIKLISEEGYEKSHFEKIIPRSRIRNCYRIDAEQMFIEVTRGKSEIYDILTHLTFLYNEAEKIRRKVTLPNQEKLPEWNYLEQLVLQQKSLNPQEQEIAFTYLTTILGRTFDEVVHAYKRLAAHPKTNNDLFHIVYWLGRISIEEYTLGKDRIITFTPILRERIGKHIYGERWALLIKQKLQELQLLDRPLHIISANMHSVMNSFFAYPVFLEKYKQQFSINSIALELIKPENQSIKKEIEQFAQKHGMYDLPVKSGTFMPVQIFDTTKLPFDQLSPEITFDLEYIQCEKPVILVMDYAFGEQAFETMDELLKPFKTEQGTFPMNVSSISIMGKAGILHGGKGDIMIPTSFVFEGTADNYPIQNQFTKKDFEDSDLQVFEGCMITVLGTSLQNKDVLSYFKNSTWRAIGLEMEGAHYHKAIQASALIRKHIQPNVTLRYAYYASDNPLVSGSTLASGSLGEIGVKPTYLITIKILNSILRRPNS
ncbi:MAG: hypothetical protein NZ551_08625 [Microscillaceae bacterium]|nr:hypothetical protein [Microscillaceae bacterium]MDW8461264.1 hypothetical protein [Cytophagales bacterium]